MQCADAIETRTATYEKEKHEAQQLRSRLIALEKHNIIKLHKRQGVVRKLLPSFDEREGLRKQREHENSRLLEQAKNEADTYLDDVRASVNALEVCLPLNSATRYLNPKTEELKSNSLISLCSSVEALVEEWQTALEDMQSVAATLELEAQEVESSSTEMLWRRSLVAEGGPCPVRACFPAIYDFEQSY
jgi:DNA repair exonuclease SbcCD ATPase subunit